MNVRAALRAPLSAFEGYKNLCQRYPKQANTAMFLSWFGILMVVGKGAEKTSCAHPLEKQLDKHRNSDRAWVPYLFADYSYKYKPL